MKKFTKGQKVRVVSPEAPVASERPTGIKVGDIVTIDKIFPENVYSLEEDKGMFFWHSDWLEPLQSDLTSFIYSLKDGDGNA